MRNILKWLTLCATGLAALEMHAADAPSGYPVDRLTVVYGRSHPEAPPVEQLGEVAVELKRDGNMLSADGAGEPVTVRISDPLPAGSKLAKSGLDKILSGLVARLNEDGIFGVIAIPNRDQIDPGSQEDLRPSGDQGLQIVVWLMEIAQVRSVAKGGRIPAEQALMNPKHAQIVAHSPLKAPSTEEGSGDLFFKPKLDEYLRRLNRHQGRIVEAALSSSDQPGRVVLDYLVNEERPWFAYFQFSNTGTEATDEFRERVGFVHNQLFNRDDVLSFDLITAALDTTNAAFLSYTMPIKFPDVVRGRVFGTWGDYQATAVLPGPTPGAGSTERFDGTQWSAGADVTWSPTSIWGMALDLTAGINFPYYDVTDKNVGTTGSVNLLVPYLAARAERFTEVYSIVAGLGYEGNFKEVPTSELNNMGRMGTDDTYDMVRAEFMVSTYLEPLFAGMSKPERWVGKALAHEISFQFRSQYVLGDERVIPQKEGAVGGLYTVRGYPESAAVGDNTYIGSLEYRFHLPRSFQPASEMTKEGATTPEPPRMLFGRPFNYRPPRAAARPSWDLIFRTFVDYGRTEVNQGTLKDPPLNERDHTLSSAGVGLELQVFRNLSARVDWGYALQDLRLGVYLPDAEAPDGQRYIADPGDWDKGDSRLHFLLTLVW